MENAAPRQRDGKMPAFAMADGGRRDLIEALEALDLDGQAAFERDCLSFMMEGWPSYVQARSSEECFTLADLKAQIDDLRDAAGDDPDTAVVLDDILGRMIETAATAQ